MRKWLPVLLLCLLLPCAALAQKLQYELTGLDHGIHFRLEWHQHDTLWINCAWSGGGLLEQTITSDGNGIFEGDIDLPDVYAGNKVYVSVGVPKYQTLLRRAEVRTLLPVTEPAERNPDGPLRDVIVCIDPGHHTPGTKGAHSEPLGPGLKGTSNKTGQATGVVTNRYEYAVCLEVAQQLRDTFLSLGAQVVMTRTDPVPYMSNQDRAAVANDSGAHIFLRLHCNAADKKWRGISIQCPLNSEYALAVADKATYHAYGDMMGEAMASVTGATYRVCCGDGFVASNWAKMPAFLIEMGFMSNPQDDRLLSDPEYQLKLVDGMVLGTVRVLQARGMDIDWPDSQE